MKVKVLAAVLALLSLAGFARAQSDVEADFYRLEIGDRIAVSVLEDPSLNQTVLVRPDGRVTLPLAGTVPAQGRTTEALQSTIRRALARNFVEAPTVTVALVGLGENRIPPGFYIVGEVARPGRYALETPVDILQGLALAGGAGAFAASDRIQLRRRVEGVETITLFDFDRVADDASTFDFLPLTDGDVIVVPQRGLFE